MASIAAEVVFAKNIRNFRWTLGWTQQQLANEMGTFRAYVADLERGRNSPTLRKLQQVADAFGVEPWVMIRPGVKIKPVPSK